MLPNLISLTGADDPVDISALKKLSDNYPLVEWALLYMPEREGKVRTPSTAWRTQALAELPRCAMHLCMKTAFEQVLAQDKTLLAELKQCSRVQLNINAGRILFSDNEVFIISTLLLQHGITQILQYNAQSAAGIQLFLNSLSPSDYDKVHILFDSSLGRGVYPSQWNTPLALKGTPLYCGYAGGLMPENISTALANIQEACQHPYWIDMEKGIRTDNVFDLQKVESVLALAS